MAAEPPGVPGGASGEEVVSRNGVNEALQAWWALGLGWADAGGVTWRGSSLAGEWMYGAYMLVNPLGVKPIG